MLQKWIYLAGLFDGEGSVQARCGKHPNKKYQCWQIWLSIANSNKEVMDYLVKEFGGNYYEKLKEQEWHKVPYQWMIWNRKQINKILISIKPYCIVKKKQIEVGLKILNQFHKGQPAKKITEEEKLTRFHLVNLLHQTNAIS